MAKRNILKTAKAKKAGIVRVFRARGTKYKDSNFDCLVETDAICVDKRYQRPCRPAHVKQIINSHDERCQRPLLLSYREGKLWVIDGQHTLKAAIQLDHRFAEADVLLGLTVKEEAEMFSLLNENQKAMAAWDKFRAGLVAENVMYVGIAELLDKYGMSTPLNTARDCDCDIVSASALVMTWKHYRASGTQRMLDALTAWKIEGRMLKVNCALVKAVGHFVNGAGKNLPMKTIKQTLHSQGGYPKSLQAHANEYKKEHGARSDKSWLYALEVLFGVCRNGMTLVV
jgi:hypothetical protein